MWERRKIWPFRDSFFQHHSTRKDLLLMITGFLFKIPQNKRQNDSKFFRIIWKYSCFWLSWWTRFVYFFHDQFQRKTNTPHKLQLRSFFSSFLTSFSQCFLIFFSFIIFFSQEFLLIRKIFAFFFSPLFFRFASQLFLNFAIWMNCRCEIHWRYTMWHILLCADLFRLLEGIQVVIGMKMRWKLLSWIITSHKCKNERFFFLFLSLFLYFT